MTDEQIKSQMGSPTQNGQWNSRDWLERRDSVRLLWTGIQAQHLRISVGQNLLRGDSSELGSTQKARKAWK